MELSTVFDAFRHGTCTVILRSEDGYEIQATGRLHDIDLSGTVGIANAANAATRNTTTGGDAVVGLSLRLDAAEVNIGVPVHA